MQDIAYMFGEKDDYYKPIQVQGLFDNNYRRYQFRGDPDRNLLFDIYIKKVIPYIRILIDEMKYAEQKIQLLICINLVHMIIKDLC